MTDGDNGSRLRGKKREWGCEPCPKHNLPQQVAGGGDTKQHHDPVPEVSGISITLDLEIAVVQNILQKVECLSFVGEVYARVVQRNESAGPTRAHVHVHGGDDKQLEDDAPQKQEMR